MTIGRERLLEAAASSHSRYRLAKRTFRWVCDAFASIAGSLISYQNLASVGDWIFSHR